MTYRIKVGYSIVVEASNEEMAIQTALNTISADPSCHINLGVYDESDVPYPPKNYNQSEAISFYLSIIAGGISKKEAEIILKRVESIKTNNPEVKALKADVIADLKEYIERI